MAFEREKVPVLVCTTTSIIRGIIHIPQGGRLTDYINNVAKNFVPITDAVIELKGGKTLKTSLIQVNKDYIVFAIPQDAIQKGDGA